MDKLEHIDDDQRIMVSRSEKIRIEKAITKRIMDLAGGPAHLARMLNINTTVALAWNHRERISKEGARLIGDHPFFIDKGITANNIRIDLDV